MDHNIDDILAAINATPDANTGDPVQDALTWESTAIPDDHPAGDIPIPGEAPTSTPQPKLKSVAGKVDVARRGMTDSGLRKSRGLFAVADANTNAFAEQSAGQAELDAEKMRGHYADLESGVGLEREATRYFQTEDQRLRQEEADFNKGQAELELRIAGEAQAERAQYISAYKEQLNVVRQLAMESGNPMTGMSKGAFGGLIGAQFAQGFLAAQGVNIDVAGQVDRWVDREMTAHQQKIANLRTSAQDQLHLYEIARQNSQDDYEARQRYRGFVIAGLQSSIQLNAGRFQSDIAMARANQQIAKLQIEADATERSIADQHYARVHQFYTTQLDAAYKQGMLAREDQRLALERKKQAWEESDLNPKNMKVKGSATDLFTISDPEDLIGDDGKPVVIDGKNVRVNRWRVDPRIVASDPVLARDIKKDGDEARNNYANYLDATNKMIDTYAKAKIVRDESSALGKFTWDELARMDKSGAVQAFIQSRDAWAMAKVYNDSGKAATDVEYKRQVNQAYADKFLANNGNKGEQSYAQLREDGRRKFERKMEDNFVAVPEGDDEYIKQSPGASPRTKAEDTAIKDGVTPDAGFAGVEVGHVTAKDSEEVHTKNVSGTWADFQKTQISSGTKIKLGQPDYAVAIDHLAAAYVRPGHFSKVSGAYGVKAEKLESPAEIREQAYTAIKGLALGVSPDGKPVPPEAMDYARHIQDAIDADEVLSPKVLNHDQDVEEAPLIDRLTWRPGSK